MIKVYNEKYIVAFGENLKRLRKKKMLTQNELAELACVGRSQIIRIENGQLNTTISTVLVLAKALNTAPQELLNFPFEGKS